MNTIVRRVVTTYQARVVCVSSAYPGRRLVSSGVHLSEIPSVSAEPNGPASSTAQTETK